ncbi:MAG: protein kinase [Deltaproteobacteria bacterium]|nr:protein kinase [Deltaproteobacteria bacterium]
MERIGRYQLIRTLAAGGMGEIYLAEHTGLAGFAKRVALKKIRPELARDKSYVQLFLNEARLGSFLNHPNIVHIFDVGHENDELWLVMEYVDGIDLKRLYRRAASAGQPLNGPLVAAIMTEVLLALEEAHGGGPTHGAPIIHRDLSPENVLVARTGAIKVLDFGLAKWVPASATVPSMEGNMIFGKVRYMPPEQLRGHLIDARADLFSLGVVMYETLKGELPFGRGTANQVLAQILKGPPPSPTEGHLTPDPAIDRIIQKALSPAPGDRYQTAEEMRSELLDYLAAQRSASPLEVLRKKLHRVATSEDEEIGGRRGHGIDFSVAERCGKCGGPFSSFVLDGLIVDRCTECRGVWLDDAELHRLLGTASRSQPRPRNKVNFEQAPLDKLVGSCPSCKDGLTAYEVPGHPASLEVCGHCLGVWFDGGELELLDDPAVDVWLRALLEAQDEDDD